MSDFDTPLRVLIVDDMEDDRDALAQFLEAEGFLVDQAGSGDEAGKLLEQNNGWYDVMLLDEVLPDINGVHLIPEIKSRYPGIQIIMFTGQEIDSGPEALALGVFRYKIKPVHPREILLDLRYISQAHLRQKAEILHRFAVSVAATSDLNILAEKILDWLKEVVNYDRATVQLIQDEGTRKLLAYRGPGKEKIEPDPELLRPIAQDALINRVIQSKRPLVLPFPQKDPDWDKTTKAADVQSWIGVPLLVNERPIGLLTIDHMKPGYYERADVEMLRMFGEPAAAAISSVAAQEEARRRMIEIEILNEVLRSISGKHQVEALLNTIMYNIAQQLDCSQISIYLPYKDNDETILKPVVHFGLDPSTLDRLHFKVGEGIAGSVFQKGVSRLISDTTRTPEFIVFSERDKQPRSILASPIKVHKRTIGVICVDQSKYGAFTKEEQGWLDALAQHAGMAIEHRRFLDDFYEIGTLIIGAHTVTDVLTRIIEGAVKLTHADSGVIYLFDKTVPHFEISQIVPYPDTFTPPKIRKNGLTRHIVTSGKILPIKDTTHPNIKEQPELRVNRSLLKLDVCSMVGIPLKAEKGVIGVFYVNSREPHEFTEPEQALLEILAGQAAIAIQQARFKDAQIRTLREIADRILSSPVQDSRDILGVILNLTTNLMGGAILGQIRLLDEKTQEFYVAVSYTDPKVRINPQYERIPVGKGITGWVAEHRQFQNIPDVTQDPRYIPYIEGTQSELAVPMLKGDEVIGVLNIEHPVPNAFTDADRRLAEAIASLAVVAMENSDLIINQKRRLDELKGILNIQHALASTPNLSEFLHMVLDEILHVTGGTCGAVQLMSDDQKALVLTVERHLPAAAVGDQHEVGDDLISWAVRNGETVNLSDISAAENDFFYQPYTPATRSVLIVPMATREQVIGVVIVESNKLDAFSAHAVQLTQGLAAPAALAIMNAVEHEQANVDRDVAVLGIRRADWHNLIRQKAYSIDTYMTAVRDLWNGGRLSPDDSEMIAEVVMGIARVTEQLQNIDQIIQVDKMEVSVSELRDIVGRLCERYEDNIHVEFDLQCPNTQLALPAAQFELVVEKLVDNALEAMRQQLRGELKLAAELVDDMVEITLHDSGPGIPAPVRPYFLKSRPPGKGTGVLIARTITTYYGGRLIWANSPSIHGTKLLLKLPVKS